MNTSKANFAISTLSLAVQGALVSMLSLPLTSFAADDEVKALTTPTNSVEIGTEYVPVDSAKFGEYNGLNKKGTYLIGNFSVRGGDAYDAFNGGNGINRWEIKGTDIGTTSRTLNGNVSNQGKWSLSISYDELQHNITNTYQTPFQGALGSNNFYLPATFGVIDVNSTVPVTDPATGVQIAGTQAMTPGQLASFQQADVYTSRKNTSFNAGFTFDEQWSIQFDFNHLQQSGAKLIGAASDTVNGGAGENSVTLMNPTNYKTDTFELALNWIGDKGHLTGSYFASIFQDGYNSLSWSNPFVDTTPAAPGVSPSTTGSNNGEFPVNTFATPPSNSLSQLNLLGGYDFTPDLKLAGGLSYSINTQNSSFINDPLMPTPPQASLNGLEATTHADLKLTDQVSKDLLLSAGVKYDDHDNRTQTNTFSSFNSIAGDTWGALVNTPMSNRDLQLLLDGNYRFDKKQSVSVAYEFDKVNRWCNNTLANTFQSQDPNANLAYYTNTGCAQSPESNENKLTAGYKLKAGDGIIFKTSYTYARRVAAISSFYNPMQTSADGFENLGFMAFFDASRTEQSIKAGVDWQNSEKLNTGLSGRYIDDKYDAMFGVQQNQTWSLNLDAAYDYSRDGSVSAYLTTQLRQRDLLSGAGVGSGVGQSPLAISTNVWSNQLTDESNMVGIKAKQKGLLGGKLDLAGDLSYSIGKTGYSTQTQNCTDTAACGTSATNSGALPDIKNEILKLKVTGNYHVNKASKVTVGYRFQKQTTSDYYYGAYQTGYTDPGVLPTNQQAPSYSVNVLSVSYLYSF